MKTVFNHRTTISSNVQPFGELSNFQFLNFSMPSSGNHCCYTSLPLKMTSEYRCRLPTETHSMIIVYSYWPGSFLKVLYFSAMPNIRPLALIPYIRPVSSIFYRSGCITFLIVAGTRGCTWFVRAPSNNCTISPTDKWISRGGARTVGACTAPREEQGPPHVLRHVRLPHGRCPNLWQPAASQLNPPSFHKTNQTPRCPQQ